MWSKPKSHSHMGVLRRGKVEGGVETKKESYTNNWIKDLNQPAHTPTNFPSSAHRTEHIYDLPSDHDDSDDGYEVPVSTAHRLKRLNKEAGLTERRVRPWEKKDLDVYAAMGPAPPVPGTKPKKTKPKPVPKKRTTKSAAGDSAASLTKSDSSLDSMDLSTSPSQHPKKALSRQKVILPVKGGSGQVLTTTKHLRSKSWDRKLPEQRLKPEAKRDEQNPEKEDAHVPKGKSHIKPVRSSSVVSENFEDALEYLPTDSAPPTKPRSEEEGGSIKHLGGSSRSIKATDTVTGGNYEEAWDLNPRLEARLSSLKLMHNRGADVVKEPINEGNYLEPWDSTRSQQELEEKLQLASKGRSRGESGKYTSIHGGERSCHDDGVSSLSSSQVSQASNVSNTSAESGSHLASPSCSPVPSVSVSVAAPVNSTDCLQNREWYHGNISRADAEKMLVVCKDGSYLVRDSSDRCHYTLSIKCSSQMVHIQIEQSATPDGGMSYILGHHSRAFPTIPAMVRSYFHEPVPIKGAQHIKLLYPVPQS